MTQSVKQGKLICVGAGMSLGAHICPVALTYIRQADIVFAASSDGLFELWLNELHDNVQSLQEHYQRGKSRKITYQDICEQLLIEVRKKKQVVAVFYGHPGVFVNPSHKAIERARNEGFEAMMIPGISAEDCLYADLGIDPGKRGCQHFEASQFMFYQRIIDPSAYLILWQIAAAGDNSHTRLKSSPPHLNILLELLNKEYPLDHTVLLYEAATSALESFKRIECSLFELPTAPLTLKTTLVIPPSKTMQKNHSIIERLNKLDSFQVV